MSFANQILKICRDNGISYSTKGEWVTFKKGDLHATAHIFDDYKDVVEVLKRTRIITNEVS